MTPPIISFIGCGNMCRSLVGGLVRDGVAPDRLRGADPVAEQRDRMHALGVEVLSDNAAAAAGADVIVLAVKPQAMREAATSLAPLLRRESPLVLSIAAGIRMDTIRGWLGSDPPLIRAMPNTPALIGAGASALCAGPRADAKHRELAEGILRAVGTVVWLEDEALMDVVTALSGSGPAYWFLLMEALEAEAVNLGLPREQARLLTIETALGAARMALESDADPSELRRQVTSPGGTTERALQVLGAGGFAELVARALAAARDRSAELAETLKGK
ncbi:MAG TPA: pyrroline-5-carboxylate reductase [Gammaproteobacteria bacterium]|jgi:pyrroline-5-carboxylate reductase